jgi:hypothetical protein
MPGGGKNWQNENRRMCLERYSFWLRTLPSIHVDSWMFWPFPLLATNPEMSPRIAEHAPHNVAFERVRFSCAVMATRGKQNHTTAEALGDNMLLCQLDFACSTVAIDAFVSWTEFTAYGFYFEGRTFGHRGIPNE